MLLLYTCREELQRSMWTVAVSELPGYPGWQHARRSRYVTAKCLGKAISAIIIDQDFTWAMPGLAWVWNHQCMWILIHPSLSQAEHTIACKNNWLC